MSYLVMARKYRPQRFEDVIDQPHITRTLRNAIANQRMAHAILLTGPRGTGKTTVARILAKAMNCAKGPTPEPCNQCTSCVQIAGGSAVDVYEIDGASNNSVDQIRELRENLQYMPAHSPLKIYIIDEVHMLSTAAFNALLKTLEEPPAHVMFIFATTEPQKIPATILSRCQRHDFRRIDMGAIQEHLRRLCSRESVACDDESLFLIAREAGGSMRDALSLLDQVSACSQGGIDESLVLDVLGVIDRKQLFELTDAVLDGDIPRFLDVLDDIYERGHDIRRLYAGLLEHFRNLLVVRMGRNAGGLLHYPARELELMNAQANRVSMPYLHQILGALFREELSVRLGPQPRLAMEMVVIRILQTKPSLPIETLIERIDALREELAGRSSGPPPGNPPSGESRPSSPRRASAQAKPESPSGEHRREAPAPPETDRKPVNGPVDEKTVNRFLEDVATRSSPLAASLSGAVMAVGEDGVLAVSVPGNGFHLQTVRRKKHLAVLKAACAALFGQEMEIRICSLAPEQDPPAAKRENGSRIRKEALSHPIVAEALEIFNGRIIDIKF